MIERFSNPNFLLGRSDLLLNIQRKAASSSKRNKNSESSTQIDTDNSNVMIENRLVALERQVQFLHLQVRDNLKLLEVWTLWKKNKDELTLLCIFFGMYERCRFLILVFHYFHI